MILKPDSSLSGSNSTLGMGVGMQVPQQHVVLYSPGAQPVAMPIVNGSMPMAMPYMAQQPQLQGQQQRFSPQSSGHGDLGMRPPVVTRQMSDSMSNGSSDLGLTLSNSMRSAMASSGATQQVQVPQYLVGLPGVSAPMNLLGQGVPLYAGTPFHQQQQQATVVTAPPPALHTPLPPAGAQLIHPQAIDSSATGAINQPQAQAPSADEQKVDPNDVGPRQLIVNYLAPSVTESELRAVFEQYGPVQCSRVIYDKNTSQSKGYGFIYYYNSAHAAAAQVGLQNFEFRGKAIRVAFAVPQRPLPM